MNIKKPDFSEKETVKSLFQRKFPGAEIDFGFVSIPSGERLPKEGTTSHTEHEYAYIVKGSLSGESGGNPFEISAGEASYIPAGEKHWCVNKSKSACELVYALIKA
ncbi:quercetin dioxygenase-like cupin family protein [Bacillus thermophilus]|uniref:Quercetin dioxygenase-like cupin family protein n=1 Tax=Siminovitchia thermophila TaxID=1245522 RepID=A0ABS2R5R0_9BACI|nr:cupin domain-containing protein [Siminovitchia thermophila]MBM7714987.1 quercetin dioxygenase-like cupin family protein [Siminovitchia thermophila]ONK21007.1 cupin [Bacillus sp. VT-16-64]